MGMQLVTHQPSQGQKVRKVYLEEGCDIARELYLGVTSTARWGRNVIMASSEAGWRSRRSQPSTRKDPAGRIDPVVGLGRVPGARLAFGLGPLGNAINSFVKFAIGRTRRNEATDASIVEINPLVVTKQGT